MTHGRAIASPLGRRAMRATATVGGGVALALAFPGAEWTLTAWVALVPVFCVAITATPRAAFAWGWLGGFAFFLLLLRWLEFTFRIYSAIPWPLTWLPVMLLAGYCAMYVGLVGAGLARVARRWSPGLALAGAPFLWVAAEWLRGQLFGGFGWGSLGYSQYRHLVAIQVAELGGVYAVTFVLVAVNAAVAGALLLGPHRALFGLTATGVLVASALGFGVWRLSQGDGPGAIAIAAVQPSIEQSTKWNPAYVDETRRLYENLTREAAMNGPGLIVWPETAAPTPLRRDPDLQRALRDVAARWNVSLLVGTIDVADSGKLRNTAFLVTPAGLVARYDKMRLVPFGEFIPFSSVIGFVKGWAQFIAEMEPGRESVIFTGPPAPFGVVICYEGVFPAVFRSFVKGGARFMVNMTNDAWFGRSAGPLQHLAIYPLRAVEHRTAVVRVANTGVSAFIAPSGRITASLGLFDRGNLVQRVSLGKALTLYTRLGDWLAYAALALSSVALLPSRQERKVRPRS